MKTLIASFLFIFSLSINAQQTLRIGTLAFDTPLSAQSDKSGNFVGFEISYMNEICKRINAKCIYKDVEFEQLFPAIKNNQIDLAIGAIIISKERSQSYLFSLPYFLSQGRFITLKDKFKSIEDLNGKTIGTISGKIYVKFLTQKFGPATKIKTFPHTPDMLFALSEGEIDAALIDEKPSEHWAAKEQKFQLLGAPFMIGGGYAIMTKKSNQQLIDNINQVILAMEKDGTYQKIYKAFFN